jgi:hypothetical protein
VKKSDQILAASKILFAFFSDSRNGLTKAFALRFYGLGSGDLARLLADFIFGVQACETLLGGFRIGLYAVPGFLRVFV